MAKKKGEPSAGPKREPPVHNIWVGRLRASIWRNEHATEDVSFNVTLSRSYKDAQGQWHSTARFGQDDLLVVGELTRLAFHWVAGIAEHTRGQPHEPQPWDEGDEPPPD